MKRKFTFIVLFFAFVYQINAQTGYTCSTPDVISALPYNITGLTTAGSGDDYNATACGGSTYMDGEDYIFTYTPAASQNIAITLSNTGLGVGLFVMDACPDATPNCVDYVEGQTGNPAIANVALSAGNTYYIIIDTYDIYGMNPNTAFDIEIHELIQFDAGVISIIAPASSCSLSGAETVTVTIQNFGLQTISSFNAAFSVNGGAPVIETVAGPILPDSSLNYTFTGTANLSVSGNSYDIEAYTDLTGDGVAANDAMTLTVVNKPVLSTFPYTEDFESGNGFWTASGENSTWDLGVPAGTVINYAASGSNAWVTNLTGNHATSEISYLESPCFDFSGLTSPRVEFSIWYETTMILGSVSLLFSLDNGISWDTLSPGSSATNWFNSGNTWSGNSAGYLLASNAVPYLAGVSNVKFRFDFDGGFIAAEGVAIDDFYIENCSATAPVAGYSYNTTGTSVDFTNTSTGATSYYWDFGDMLMGSSTDMNPTYDFMIDGSYTVTLIAMNECFSDTSIQIIDIVTGIVDQNNSEPFTVYPNPADNFIFINTQLASHYQIIDIKGEVITSGINIPGTLINVSKLDKGIYLLRITEEENNYTRKLVIE